MLDAPESRCTTFLKVVTNKRGTCTNAIISKVAKILFVAYFNLFVRKGEKRSKKEKSSYLYNLCREFIEVGVRKGQEKCEISDKK